MEPPRATTTGLPGLDERERLLLAALASGADMATAARRIGVSVRTARRGARALDAKLGASTLCQAVHVAAKRGLI